MGENLAGDDSAMDYGVENTAFEHNDEGDGAGSASLDTPDPDALHVDNHREFAALYLDAKVHEDERGVAAPGTIRVDGALQPWADRVDNPEPERYIAVPEPQREIEQQYAAHGFDDTTLAMVNAPDGHDRERQQNCGECARAVASLLNGQPEAARPLYDSDLGDGEHPVPGEPAYYMEMALGRPGAYNQHLYEGDAIDDETTHDELDANVARGFAALEDDLRRGGDGSHAVVALTWKPELGAEAGDTGGGHWMNAANIDGRIVYIDGQQAERGERTAAFMDEYARQSAAMSWIRSDRRESGE